MKKSVVPKSSKKKNISQPKTEEKTVVEGVGEVLSEVISKKKVRYGLIIISTLVIVSILILLILGIKLRFMIKDELNLIMGPKAQSLHVLNGEQVSINFAIKNDNFIQCKSSCTIELKDLSNGVSIYSGKLILSHNEERIESFNVSVPVSGEGQILYNFVAECNNIKSLLCLTDGQKRQKLSLVTLNYNLDPDEELIKNSIKPRLDELNILIANISSMKKNVDVIIGRGSNIDEVSILIDNIDIINNGISNILEFQNKSIFLWELEDYNSLNNVFPEGIIDDSKEIINTLNLIENDILGVYENYNDNIKTLVDFGDDLNEISIILDYYDSELNSNNFILSQEIRSNYNVLNQIYSIYSYGSNLSQEKVHNQLFDAIKNINDSISIYNEMVDEGSNLITQGYSVLGQNYSVDVFECNILEDVTSEIMDIYYNISSHSNKSIKDKSLEEMDNFIAYSNLFMGANCKDDNFNESISDLNFSVLKFEDLKFLNTSDFNEIVNPLEISDNLPICCIFGECNSCVDGNYNNSINPILFIHGHIFNEADSPEYSLSSFIKIQDKLQEEGVINAGEMDLTNSIGAYDWGRNNNPLSVRASYYYISFYNLGDYNLVAQKTEKIENYAIRLKEIIEEYKFRTGSDKVNIIAHSMGGLVAREYIALFGSYSVDKVILINTPNHGVTESIGSSCRILGSSNECDDMSKGSIFLSRLNSKKLPDSVGFHVIRSVGCDMDGVDGDGIVTGNSVYLEGAVNYEIKGSCTNKLNNDLHSNVLNPNMYPEVYDLIVGVLKS